jgi:hypothetical protein
MGKMEIRIIECIMLILSLILMVQVSDMKHQNLVMWISNLQKRSESIISEAMDEAGKYTSQIFDYEGTHYLNLEEPEK